MTLPAHLAHLDGLLDLLVVLLVDDAMGGTHENGDASGQEQRRRGDQGSETVPRDRHSSAAA